MMDGWEELVRLARAYALRQYGREAVALTIHLEGGESARQPLPPRHLEELRTAQPASGWASGPEPKHSTDFARVYWPGLEPCEFRLSGKQRLVVEELWRAREEGEPAVAQGELLRAAGSDATRLHDLFRRSPAWGTLIVAAGDGRYRLPEDEGPAE